MTLSVSTATRRSHICLLIDAYQREKLGFVPAAECFGRVGRRGTGYSDPIRTGAFAQCSSLRSKRYQRRQTLVFQKWLRRSVFACYKASTGT
jgi:hypothetical protein